MKKLFAMLLALTMLLSMAACTPANDSPETTTESTAGKDEVKVMTYQEYMAAKTDAIVCVETYVQATQGWWEDKITIYAQGTDAGYFMYNMACTKDEAAKLVPGTKIRATGTKAIFNGEVEIMNGTFEIIEGATPYIAEYMDATALLGTNELETHMNKKVSFKGMTVVASEDKEKKQLPFLYKWDGSGKAGDDLYFNVSVNNKVYTFCVESYLTGDGTEVYEAVEGLKVGDVLDMEGFLYWYETAQPHITSVKKAA